MSDPRRSARPVQADHLGVAAAGPGVDAALLWETPEDRVIFRIVKHEHLVSDLAAGRTRFVTTDAWPDPLEDPLRLMAIEDYGDDDRIVQTFAGDRAPSVYAQCWSMTAESDPLWRAYSPGPNEDGFWAVQVVSTTRKLLTALMAVASDPSRVFAGSVRYRDPQLVTQDIVNALDLDGLAFFDDPKQRAIAALFKRRAFAHEDEVRLLIVARPGLASHELFLAWDHNTTTNAIVLDPRTHHAVRDGQARALREAGFRGSIAISDLYQRTFFQVPVGRLARSRRGTRQST